MFRKRTTRVRKTNKRKTNKRKTIKRGGLFGVRSKAINVIRGRERQRQINADLALQEEMQGEEMERERIVADAEAAEADAVLAEAERRATVRFNLIREWTLKEGWRSYLRRCILSFLGREENSMDGQRLRQYVTQLNENGVIEDNNGPTIKKLFKTDLQYPTYQDWAREEGDNYLLSLLP